MVTRKYQSNIAGVAIGVDVKAKVTPRIVNGTSIDIEEVPWQGSLHVLIIGEEPTVAFLQQICGTVLIGHKWALTAAHCTVDQKANALLVRFGSAMLYRGGNLNEITRIIQHEQFNPFTMDFDFSLLELTNLMMFTQHIRPVSLPKVLDDFPPGTSAFVSGWGETRDLSQQQFNLRGATIPLYNHTKCIQAYRATNDVTSRMICAGFEQGGKDGKRLLFLGYSQGQGMFVLREIEGD